MTEYRLGAQELLTTLEAWDHLMEGRGPVHLIACGGTALTLLGYKPSTIDVDFLIPVEEEHKRLLRFLSQVGYEQLSGHRWKRPNELVVFDLFAGNFVYTTGLLNSPLEKGGHRKIREFKILYLGVLNPVDLIITKLFRGSGVDFEDCEVLFRSEKINMDILESRYLETASYETSQAKVLRNFEFFKKRVLPETGKKL